jgi:hypothetical protein
MDNKYYTPEIEEFHPCFQYEELSGVDNEQEDWSEHNFMIEAIQDYIGLYKLIKEKCIRVKYLDRSDIESLGFKHFQDGVYEKTSRLEISNNYQGWRIIEISKDFGEHKFEIRCAHPSSKFGGFYGVIKNKSELKKLFKQLNII